MIHTKPCPLCSSTELILVPCFCHLHNGQVKTIQCKCGLVFVPPGTSTTAEVVAQWNNRPLDIERLQPSRN